jgi:hypothetical protein
MGMSKHVFAAILWFVSAWAVGSAIDFATGQNSAWLAPAFGLLFGGIAVVDPLRLFTAQAQAR